MRGSQARPPSRVYAMCGIVRRQNGRLKGSTSLAVRASRLVSHPPLDDAIHPALVSIHHESRSFCRPPSLPPSLRPQSVRPGTTTTTENNEFDSLSIANGLLRVAGRRARKSDRSTPTPQRCVQNRSRHDMKVDSSKTPGKAPFDVYMCAKTGFHDGGMQIFVRRQKRSSREDTTRALT